MRDKETFKCWKTWKLKEVEGETCTMKRRNKKERGREKVRMKKTEKERIETERGKRSKWR
jgi:hypothetical protein